MLDKIFKYPNNIGFGWNFKFMSIGIHHDLTWLGFDTTQTICETLD